MATQTATMTVTRGPARGKFFELEPELVHIGRGEKNEVVLDDPELAEHAASIVRRNGRYAIYTPLDETVSVDGNCIPPDRWVWLPAVARIELGRRTCCQFSSTTAAGTPAADPATGDRSSRKKGKGRGRRRQRQVARFVTDESGDARVQLGEDGHLPELSLVEGPGGRPAERREQRGVSPLAYLLIAVSMTSSVLLVFLVPGDRAGGPDRTASRRDELRRLIEKHDGSQAPWLLSLRDALQAHARKDRAAERRHFRIVLDMLEAEDLHPSNGLTGNLNDDDDLRVLLKRLFTE